MFNKLTTPRFPAASLSFPDHAVTMLEITKRRGSFSLKHYATTQIPEHVLAPSFDSPNIVDEGAFLRALRDTAQIAGLLRQRRWSASLPEQTVRSAIITLEGVVEDRNQMQEVINWRTERVIGTPAEQLRLSQQRLSKVNGQFRYLITAVRKDVVEQYEKVFASAGWQIGVIFPRHLAEAQWLAWDKSNGAKLLVTGNDTWITVIILAGDEPVMVRSIQCDPDGRADEVYRVVQYYRDRLSDQAPKPITSAMVVGTSPTAAEVKQILSEILNQTPEIIDAANTGLDFDGNRISFNNLAAAAGLASSAWM